MGQFRLSSIQNFQKHHQVVVLPLHVLCPKVKVQSSQTRWSEGNEHFHIYMPALAQAFVCMCALGTQVCRSS